jgi:hypothetical protein
MKKSVEHGSNDNDRRKPNYPKKSLFPRQSTKNLPRIGMGSNPNLRGDRPPTNLLTHSTIWVIIRNSPKKHRGGKKADSVTLNFAYSYTDCSALITKIILSCGRSCRFLNPSDVGGHVFESVSQYDWMTALIYGLTLSGIGVDLAMDLSSVQGIVQCI